MNENITLYIVGGIVIIAFLFVIGYVNSPTEFTLNLNITHTADNNTRALYEALNKTLN